jgi:hypothetical protein
LLSRVIDFHCFLPLVAFPSLIPCLFMIIHWRLCTDICHLRCCMACHSRKTLCS